MHVNLMQFSNLVLLFQRTHVNLIDLVKSFQTSSYLQNLASIQPRTSLGKFARSPCTDHAGSSFARHLSVELKHEFFFPCRSFPRNSRRQLTLDSCVRARGLEPCTGLASLHFLRGLALESPLGRTSLPPPFSRILSSSRKNKNLDNILSDFFRDM